MFYILISAITATTFLLQVAILPFTEIQGVSVNIVVIVAIFWLIHIRLQFSVIYAVVIGFLLDLYSQSFFGSHVIAIVVTLGILKLIIDTYFQKENFGSTILLQVLGIIFFSIILVLTNFIAARLRINCFTFDFVHFVAIQIPLAAMWSAVVTALLFRPFQRLSDIVEYFQHRSKNA